MYLTKNYKVKKAPLCKHCGTKMTKIQPPPYNIGDGLGWGVKYLWVCFNDECPFFVEGWEHMRITYGKTASYRFMCFPDNGETGAICVLSYDGLKGQIIHEDDEEED